MGKMYSVITSSLEKKDGKYTLYLKDETKGIRVVRDKSGEFLYIADNLQAAGPLTQLAMIKYSESMIKSVGATLAGECFCEGEVEDDGHSRKYVWFGVDQKADYTEADDDVLKESLFNESREILSNIICFDRAGNGAVIAYCENHTEETINEIGEAVLAVLKKHGGVFGTDNA